MSTRRPTHPTNTKHVIYTKESTTKSQVHLCGIGVTGGTQAGSANELSVRSHEVSILLDVVLSIQPWEDSGKESLVIAISGAKLGEVDRQAGLRVGIFDVRLEVFSVGAYVIPVNGNSVDFAVSAVAHEAAEPGQTHGCSTVGNSWGDELGLASEVVGHVGLVSGGSCLWRQVGLLSVIWFIESQESSGTSSNTSSGVFDPGGGLVRRGTPEHRKIFNTASEASVH